MTKRGAPSYPNYKEEVSLPVARVFKCIPVTKCDKKGDKKATKKIDEKTRRKNATKNEMCAKCGTGKFPNRTLLIFFRPKI